jgi:hypothetical protein
MLDHVNCPCLEHAPRHPYAIRERDLGRDETDGRFADVELIRCGRCRRLWLRYYVEYEAFTGSGRWAETPIDEATAATMTAATAPEFIHAAEWHVFGGSYWGHAGKRGKGRLSWN